MVGCGTLVNCTDLYTPRTIDVLPDIVGIGVLTSFIVTTIAAFGAIIFGYFTDTLPSSYLNPADFAFLDAWRWCKRCRAKSRFPVGNRSSSGEPCKHSNPKIYEKKWKGLIAFILSLSDQELVIGLAIIIAALSQRCTISNYEFQVVSSLAWLASTTHLTTLLVLREYFQDNKFVRNIRVVGMMVNLVLLIYVTLMNGASYIADNSAPIQCVLDDGSFFRQSLDLSTVLTIFLLLNQYVSTICQLYTKQRGARDWLLRSVLHTYCCKWHSTLRFSEENFEYWYEGTVVQNDKRPRSAAKMERLYRKAMVLPDETTSRLQHLSRCMYFAWCSYDASFLSNIPSTVLYNASYGVTQVIISRQNMPHIDGSENTVDFGQIVPLFLLWLPILAIIEVYSDVHIKTQNEDLNASNAPAQTTSTEKALIFVVKTLLEDCSPMVTSPNGTHLQGSQSLGNNSRIAVSGRATTTLQSSFHNPATIHGDGSGVQTTTVWTPAIINMQKFLTAIFFASAASYLLLGVGLWIFPFYIYLWISGFYLWTFWYIVQEIIFIHGLIKNLRHIRKEDIKPPGGLRAPLPSLRNATLINQSLEALPRFNHDSSNVSQSSLVEEPIDITDIERNFEAPRRRRTHGELDDGDEVSLGRSPIRSDTEANIGIQN